MEVAVSNPPFESRGPQTAVPLALLQRHCFLFTVKDSGGAKERDMRKCLRKISELRFSRGSYSSERSPEIVSQCEQALEQFARFLLRPIRWRQSTSQNEQGRKTPSRPGNPSTLLLPGDIEAPDRPPSARAGSLRSFRAPVHRRRQKTNQRHREQTRIELHPIHKIG